MNEKQVEKIREKIKNLRSRLAAEKRRFGGYFDNGGARYKIPELYIQLGDFKGALSYFNWFSREFPDDAGFTFFFLLWAFTLFKNRKERDAVRAVYKTCFSNIYLVDLLCNRPITTNIRSTGGAESLDYARELVEPFNNLLTKDFKTWLCKLNETEEFRSNINKFISIQKLLDDESLDSERSQLREESKKLMNLLTGEED